MSKETKFGYGFLLVGAGMPYLIDRLVGPGYAHIFAVLIVLAGIFLLISGHSHEHKGLTWKIMVALLVILSLLVGYIWRFRPELLAKLRPVVPTAEQAPSPTPPIPSSPPLTSRPPPYKPSKPKPPKGEPRLIEPQLPPLGNLGDQAQQLGGALIDYANERLSKRPDRTIHPEDYKTWYSQNDGIWFYQRKFDRYVIELHDRLLKSEYDDVRLDALLEEYKRDFDMRQKFVEEAAKFPEGFHLSIDQIRQMGELFQLLGKQVHY